MSRLVDWEAIDTVLLDMDGTLLDKHFDDYFWEELVPERFAELNNIPVQEARSLLLDLYRSREGTLEWTDLDYWSRRLNLDIPGLKNEVDHLIAVHPYVPDFLKFCRRKEKRVILVTNAHSKTLAIKMAKTGLDRFFDAIVCAEEVGTAKEDPGFWPSLQQLLHFTPSRTMLADDNEKVLDSAASFGFGSLIFVARPSSRQPVKRSHKYPSIVYFSELME